MKSKFKKYFKSGFSNFLKIISREIREKIYFEFLEKFSRRTQSSGMRPQSKEYPVKRLIPISRSDGVVALLYPRTLDGRPGPILGESMPNPSLMRG
jgi:hypothetical protein